MTINVCILSLDWSVAGGAENYAISLKQGLLANNIDCQLVTLMYDRKANFCEGPDLMLDINSNFSIYEDYFKKFDLIFFNSSGNYVLDKESLDEIPKYYQLLESISKLNCQKHLMFHGARQELHSPYLDLIKRMLNFDFIWGNRESILGTFGILEVPVVNHKKYEKINLNKNIIKMTSRVTPYKNQDKLIKLSKLSKFNIEIYGANFLTTNIKEKAFIKQLEKDYKVYSLFEYNELDSILCDTLFHANLSDYSDKVKDFARETTTIEAIQRGCIPILSKQMSRGFTHNHDCFIIDLDKDLDLQAKRLRKFMDQSLSQLKKIHQNALKVIEPNNYIKVANKLISEYTRINQNGKTGYELALQKVTDVRKERSKAYGDFWKESNSRFFTTMIEEKAARLGHMFDSGSNEYEKIEDTLIDIANYSLMYLDNRLRGNKK